MVQTLAIFSCLGGFMQTEPQPRHLDAEIALLSGDFGGGQHPDDGRGSYLHVNELPPNPPHACVNNSTFYVCRYSTCMYSKK